MNTLSRTSTLAVFACLLIACGGASNGSAVDAGGPGADAATDTTGDTGSADAVTDPDAVAPDAAEPADTSTTDAGADIAAPDADTESDGAGDAEQTPDAASDTADADASVGDTIEADSTADAEADTPDAADDIETDGGDAVCEFLDLDIRILDCNGDYKYLRGWTAPFDTSGACVPYFTISGDDTRYATADDAINTTDCSPECQYVASTSVTWLYCGRRSGYIIYSTPDEACGDLYEMPEGIYTSIEAYEAANPCAP
ncbi:MAG: hypothetical protein KGO50_11570 [Myxococcales bacterium]|nr:hypothetical protein [Myxococcales bacterium]